MTGHRQPWYLDRLRAELERVATIEDRRERGPALGRLRPVLGWLRPVLVPLRPSPQTLVALAAVLALVAVVLAVAWESDIERPAAPPQPTPTTAPAAPQDTALAYLAKLPARKSCGLLGLAPVGYFSRIRAEVVKGDVPCRVARRVLKTHYRTNSPEIAAEAAAPWRCSGPDGLVVCYTDPGPGHNLIRARYR